MRDSFKLSIDGQSTFASTETIGRRYKNLITSVHIFEKVFPHISWAYQLLIRAVFTKNQKLALAYAFQIFRWEWIIEWWMLNVSAISRVVSRGFDSTNAFILSRRPTWTSMTEDCPWDQNHQQKTSCTIVGTEGLEEHCDRKLYANFQKLDARSSSYGSKTVNMVKLQSLVFLLQHLKSPKLNQISQFLFYISVMWGRNVSWLFRQHNIESRAIWN